MRHVQWPPGASLTARCDKASDRPMIAPTSVTATSKARTENRFGIENRNQWRLTPGPAAPSVVIASYIRESASRGWPRQLCCRGGPATRGTTTATTLASPPPSRPHSSADPFLPAVGAPIDLRRRAGDLPMARPAGVLGQTGRRSRRGLAPDDQNTSAAVARASLCGKLINSSRLSAGSSFSKNCATSASGRGAGRRGPRP